LLVAGGGRRDPLVGISGHAMAAPCSNSMPRPTESRDRPSPACRVHAGRGPGVTACWITRSARRRLPFR
jgi:hypothetical protein